MKKVVTMAVALAAGVAVWARSQESVVVGAESVVDGAESVVDGAEPVMDGGVEALPLLEAVAVGDGQDALLDKVESGCAAVASLQANFDQSKVLLSGKTIQSGGVLYFQAPDKMSMLYEVPAGEKFIINSNSLLMVRDGKTSLFNTDKNQTMGSLSSTLLDCICGRVRELAARNDATLEATSAKDGISVILTARKKAAKGYSKIILLYDRSMRLTYMELVEHNGVRNTYSMTSIRTGIAIESEVFAIK